MLFLLLYITLMVVCLHATVQYERTFCGHQSVTVGVMLQKSFMNLIPLPKIPDDAPGTWFDHGAGGMSLSRCRAIAWLASYLCVAIPPCTTSTIG